jgi:hypothetical protein
MKELGYDLVMPAETDPELLHVKSQSDNAGV